MAEAQIDAAHLLQLYHLTATLVARTGRLEDTLGTVLDAAMRLLGADKGNLQLLDPAAEGLRLVAQRGFGPDFVERFEVVRFDSESTACSVAFATGERVVVADVTTAEIYDEASREALLADDVRSLQSTPLTTRDGVVTGVISTHFTRPHVPSDDALHILDLYARAAADAIERDEHLRLLRHAEEVKDDFLGMVSHELRSPLTSVLGFAQLLYRRREAIADPVARDAVETLLVEARRLDTRLANMLVLARLDAVSVELEPVQLGRLVERDVAAARRRGIPIDFLVTEEIVVSANPEWVSQVVTNLLENAEKYGAAQKGLEVHVERDDDEAVVRVLDRGPGIDPTALERVFKPFFRGAALDEAPGIGVGLTVCLRLAEAQGGRMELLPRDGGGTEARFVLRTESDV